jgi:DNA invertase Pin-like site-specific DNA recombinase
VKQTRARTVLRAGVYARISADRAGDELGVRRQVADCESLARRQGFVVAERYVDNDVSAYNGARRPEYERLLADLRAGRIEAVIAWHPDRLYRHPRDLEAFVETVEGAGAAVATVQAGELDLSTASGRMVARMLGAAARFESEHKAERQRRKHLELAESGRPSGGGDRPFGFDADRVTVRDDEAAEIRGAVIRILAGGSLRSIVLDWSVRGIRTPRGGVWSKTSARRMLASSRIAGLREHRGQVVGSAVWKGIITPAQHEAVKAILTDPSRRRAMPARRYLLTGGIARCGRCGAAMVARPNERRQRRYACAKDFGGCDRTFHLADTLEEYVRDAVFLALDGPALVAMRARAPQVEDDVLAQKIAALETRRREAVDAYGEGGLSLASFRAIDRDLEARLSRARGELAARARSRITAALPSTTDALRGWWESVDLEQRRQLVGLIVDRVEVGPAVKGRNRFDPERVQIAWRV